MGNSTSETSVLYQPLSSSIDKTKSTKFIEQLEQSKIIHKQRIIREKQMKQQFANDIMNHIIAVMKETIPDIILDKAKRGIHGYIYFFEITDDIKRMYCEQRKLNELTDTDKYHIMFGIY